MASSSAKTRTAAKPQPKQRRADQPSSRPAIPSDGPHPAASAVEPSLPALVREALARRAELLEPVLARWNVAGTRLRVGPNGLAIGALVLALDLDLVCREKLLGQQAERSAPRRVHLITGVRDLLDEASAVDGLTQLEARGVLRQLADFAGPWHQGDLELHQRVRTYCLSYGSFGRASAGLDGRNLPPSLALAVEEAARKCVELGLGQALVAIRGRFGTARDSVMEALLATLGVGPLRKTLPDLRASPDALEPELSGLAPVWDPRTADPSPDDYSLATKWLARGPGVAVALLDRHQDVPDVAGRQHVVIQADPRGFGVRRDAWAHCLAAKGASAPVVAAAAERLALRSRAGAGLAWRATQMLREHASLDAASLVASVEANLAALVRPSTLRGVIVEQPEVTLDQLIVSAEARASISHFVVLANNTAQLQAGTRVGAKAMFSGPSGTGKTMAARAIASSLQLPLFRVDLASVVSKWVGETERNLRQALESAEAAGAVLLFDEGEALMGKRGEVTRGTDRYANLEVSYLLQAMETHDGVVIVTTNLRGNLDRAFERRFDVCIDFSAPTKDQRVQLWRQELGHAGRTVGEPALRQAASAELSGGSIAAAARLARAFACGRGSLEVTESEVLASVSAELQKMGAGVQAARWAERARGNAGASGQA